jgi:hypothetical protein
MSETHHVEIKHYCGRCVCDKQIALNPGDIVILHYDDACEKYIVVPSGNTHSCAGCELLDKDPIGDGPIPRCKIRDIEDDWLCLMMSTGVLRHSDSVLEEI